MPRTETVRLTVSVGLDPAAGSQEPTLAAAFYWRGPVRPVKKGPTLKLDVVDYQVWHHIFLEGTGCTTFVGPVPAGG